MSRTALVLLQTYETHAYFDLHHEAFWEGGGAVYRPAGGYARLATLIARARAERPGAVLYADCGDTLHGTFPAVHSQGSALVPVLNALGADAMVPHREFAYGPAAVHRRAAELAFPILAANVRERDTGRAAFPAVLVREAAGLRIGLVGEASNIVDTTMPPSYSEGLSFSVGREALQGAVDALRAEDRVDLVVLLSHLGLPQEVRLLTELRGVDVCLSGHTHNRLRAPVRSNGMLSGALWGRPRGGSAAPAAAPGAAGLTT